MLTLYTLALLHHTQPVLPSSSCSILSPSLLRVDCLSSSLLGGPGPPSHLSPELTPFPSGPRQRPTLMLGTLKIREYVADSVLIHFFVSSVILLFSYSKVMSLFI
jgi:hypothetical protein